MNSKQRYSLLSSANEMRCFSFKPPIDRTCLLRHSYPDERFDEDLNLFAECSVSSAFRAVLMAELLPV